MIITIATITPTTTPTIRPVLSRPPSSVVAPSVVISVVGPSVGMGRHSSSSSVPITTAQVSMMFSCSPWTGIASCASAHSCMKEARDRLVVLESLVPRSPPRKVTFFESGVKHRKAPFTIWSAVNPHWQRSSTPSTILAVTSPRRASVS